MNRLLNLLLATLFLLSACKTEVSKPNIIIILADDMGYSDIACYGGEIRTPNLDMLAAHGLRFTQFYNTGRCCPTRASLLTGLYAHQTSIGHMTNMENHLPGFHGDLNQECVTIAEVLSQADYKCYMSGKYHVAWVERGEKMVTSSKHNWPLQRGFDRFYGTILGAGSLWDPTTLVRDMQFISPLADPEYTPENYYYTDAISDQAIRYVDEHNSDQPFFMYVAYTAAHWPMHAPEEEIDKYKGVYDEGYRAIREARYNRMLELGVINAGAEMSPQVGNWEDMEFPEWELRCMETYAAMTTRMDAGIGRIVESLRENGQLENTLILFMQDNGGCQEEIGRLVPSELERWGAIQGPRAESASLPPMGAEEFQTEMVPSQSRDGYPMRMGPGSMPGPADTYIAYGENWANVSNTPFRLYKHFVHEGGISTPLIAHWPKGIKDQNQLRHTPAHLIDLMATCVDLSGASYPTEYSDYPIQPMEGISLRSIFETDQAPQRHILFEHESNAAIRMGKWKLVGTKVMERESTIESRWELYNIEEDRSELHNLASTHPEKLQEMKTLFEAEASRVRFFPSKYGKKD